METGTIQEFLKPPVHVLRTEMLVTTSAAQEMLLTTVLT